MQFYYEAGIDEYSQWPDAGMESTVTVDLSAVPEPATILLFALGGVVLLKKRRA